MCDLREKKKKKEREERNLLEQYNCSPNRIRYDLSHHRFIVILLHEVKIPYSKKATEPFGTGEPFCSAKSKEWH
jgi:hypothetical protein